MSPVSPRLIDFAVCRWFNEPWGSSTDLTSLTTRVAVLADKHVVAVAPVQTLETSTHPWIQEYFLGPRGRAASQKFRTQA
jgi:ABC-type transporter Mla maintaining outer membrane lipid asymmetry ATPase subunit MlaF